MNESPRGRRVVWTTHCTGCTELGDYGQDAHLSPWDAKAMCRIGMGCSECGYTGKRRQIRLEESEPAPPCMPKQDIAKAYTTDAERKDEP
jgi:hypothetical protein